jgi:hypothetical protein
MSRIFRRGYEYIIKLYPVEREFKRGLDASRGVVQRGAGFRLHYSNPPQTHRRMCTHTHTHTQIRMNIKHVTIILYT